MLAGDEPLGLGALAAVGSFFAVATGPALDPTGPEGLVHGESGLPLTEAHRTDPGSPWRARIADVAARLGTAEPRVAASIAFQGLAARLWSVALGAAVLTGHVPDLGPGRLWWHPDRPAPADLRLPDPRPTAVPGDTAARLAATVLHGHLVPLVRASRAASGVSERVLWGNAGSALAGTVGVLHGWARTAGASGGASAGASVGAPAGTPGAAAAGEAADRAGALARALFTDPLLRGTGTVSASGGRPGFVRRSCCLYYRVPGGGLCGDCVLRTRVTERP
ncbi:(2Fe-2S)-binding protein [Streptomyces sp. URMC 123]